MGCAGSEEGGEPVELVAIEGEEEDPYLEEYDPAAGPPKDTVQVRVLCDKHILQVFAGASHTVQMVLDYVSRTLSAAESHAGHCECTGLTSGWAIEDGCTYHEDDHLFELDGWPEAVQSNPQEVYLIALTKRESLDRWLRKKSVIPLSEEGWTTIITTRRHWERPIQPQQLPTSPTHSELHNYTTYSNDAAQQPPAASAEQPGPSTKVSIETADADEEASC